MHRKLIKHIKKRAHHFFFFAVLGCLVVLTGWWTLFIKKMIDHSFDQDVRYAEQQAQVLALQIRLERMAVLAGPFPGHENFEIVSQKKGDAFSEISSGLFVQPTMQYLMSLENERRKKTSMVFGEGSVLGLSVLVSCFMLYQYIRLEKRSKEELYEFWSRVTHEIKTPITGIRAFLETLKRGTLSPKDQAYMVDLALKQVERQQQLTQNILMGRQLEQGLKLNQNESLRIVRFIENYINSHILQLSGIKTNIEREGLPLGTAVQADPNSLHTILDNLVDNAIKYGPKDLQLDFTLKIVGSKVQICIKDNGPGFPPEMADHLFDAYRRLAGELPEGKHGTGMGLHICRSLARHMGGDMNAESEGLGKGASFILILKHDKEAAA